MRAMDLPDLGVLAVYNECLKGITNTDLEERLKSVLSDVESEAFNYSKKASDSELYMLDVENGADDTPIVGDVTKKELNSLYSQYMVAKAKPARVMYDKLKNSAPGGKCPFCGFGQAETLDHYLPKSEFPIFSVTPQNLVPACRACNSKKGIRVASSKNDQCLHPYFDHSPFVDDRWLYAKIAQTSPASVEFYDCPPDSWDSVSKQRVKAHFNDFKLAKRYKIESVDELATVRELLLIYEQTLSINDIKKHLLQEARANEKVYVNSWKTALYYAMSGSNWYIGCGFK